MPRGSVPMRARRRQSDAKWRASVSTCYETLKHVIPDCDKISKRKISKALILQETEKHINNLENVLSDILSDKARSRGKAVLYQTAQGLVEANLNDVQQDLALKQQTMYLHNYGRKRCNIPADIEAGIVNLRATFCPLTVLPVECLQQQQVVPSTPNLSSVSTVDNNLTNEDKENIQMFINHQDLKPNKIHVPHLDSGCEFQNTSLLKTPVRNRPKRTKRTATYSTDYEYYSPGEITPTKYDFKPSHVTPNSRHKHSSRTPVRAHKHLRLDSHTGFTPVKLPTSLDHGTPRQLSELQTGFTPIKLPADYGTPSRLSDIQTGFTPIKLPTESELPDSPFTTICMKSLSPESRERLDSEYAWSEQIGLSNLLCDETIDHMDLGDEKDDIANINSRTPQNNMRNKEQKNIEKGKKFRSSTMSNKDADFSQNVYTPGTNRKTETKCRRQLEKCFSTEKENPPVITGVFDNTDTSCLDFDGYFLFYQYVAGDKDPSNMLQGETASRVSQMWKEMPDETRDTFIAMAALESSQSDSSHLSDDLRELDVKPIVKGDLQTTCTSTTTVKKEENRGHIFVPLMQPPQNLTSRPVFQTFTYTTSENKRVVSLQEVPSNHIILPCTAEQLLVPDISEQVTIVDSSEREVAVVPEISILRVPENIDAPMTHMDHIIGQNIEVYSDNRTFQLVPDKDNFGLNHSDRARADDLGFISLSNENSMSEDFSQQFSSQVTVDDLTEWNGQIVPIV